MDGSFADWAGVKVEYRDTVGDTFHRDYDGYGGLHYTNDTGRNDIITSKVAVDRRHGLFLRRDARKRSPRIPAPTGCSS